VRVPAAGSRLLELRRSHEAARLGRELLDQKRDVLLRELLRREQARQRLASETAAALGQARCLVREARVELGRDAVEAAALAQPPAPPINRRDASLLGVRLPRLSAAVVPFRPRYGPAGTSESLDRAGASYAALLPQILRLAEEDSAVRSLREAVSRTTRLLNALEKVVLPGLEDDIHYVVSVLEEEERDQAIRNRRARSVAATLRARVQSAGLREPATQAEAPARGAGPAASTGC
jgi:V/A-type H+-transporting ATPase subunit D